MSKNTWKTSGCLVVVLSAATSAFAGLACTDLKSQIDEKLKAKNVSAYTLTVVPNDSTADGKVVGTCDGGKNKIVYVRGASPAKAETPAAATKPAATPTKK